MYSLLLACHMAAEANLSRAETIQLFDVGGLLGPRLTTPLSTTMVTLQWTVPCSASCGNRFAAAEGPLAVNMMDNLIYETGCTSLTGLQNMALQMVYAEEWRCEERLRVHFRRGNINRAALRRRSEDEIHSIERTLLETTPSHKVYLMEATVVRKISWTVVLKADRYPPDTSKDVAYETIPHVTKPLTGFVVRYQSPAWKMAKYWQVKTSQKTLPMTLEAGN